MDCDDNQEIVTTPSSGRLNEKEIRRSGIDNRTFRYDTESTGGGAEEAGGSNPHRRAVDSLPHLCMVGGTNHVGAGTQPQRVYCAADVHLPIERIYISTGEGYQEYVVTRQGRLLRRSETS